jgi:predicted nucleotide-binding protein
MKHSVARVLEKLGLEPVILHEQPDKGRTVIEKFVDYSDVGFAVVCLSPDDLAYANGSAPEVARPRARQNVVLELGFFLGKLGRERVLVLHKEVEGFEMPSDYAGVLFKPYDAHGNWCFQFVQELAACGYKVDANRLLKA